MKMAYILARLAVSRGRLQRAIATAHACGDSDYVRENRPDLDLLERKIDALVKCLRPEVVEDAREITNAPI
jgi:hypothetical protein